MTLSTYPETSVFKSDYVFVTEKEKTSSSVMYNLNNLKHNLIPISK